MKKGTALFIHGLGSNHENTWKTMELALKSDEKITEKYNFLKFEYNTRIINYKLEKLTPIIDIASTLTTFIQINIEKHSKIVLLAHSMGGIICKYFMLLESGREEKRYNIGALFFATPHTGTEFAKIGKIINLRNPQIPALGTDSECLKTLNLQWKLGNLDGKYQTRYLAGSSDEYVTVMSATDTYSLNHDVIDADHYNITEPNEIIYKITHNFLYDFKKKVNNTLKIKTYHNEIILSIATEAINVTPKKKEILYTIYDTISTIESIDKTILKSENFNVLRKITEKTKYDEIIETLTQKNVIKNCIIYILNYKSKLSSKQHEQANKALVLLNTLETIANNPNTRKALLISGSFGSGKTTIIEYIVENRNITPLYPDIKLINATPKEQIASSLDIPTDSSWDDILNFASPKDQNDNKVCIIIDDIENQINPKKNFLNLLEGISTSNDFYNILWIISIDTKSIPDLLIIKNMSTTSLLHNTQIKHEELFMGGWINLDLYNSKYNCGINHIKAITNSTPPPYIPNETSKLLNNPLIAKIIISAHNATRKKNIWNFTNPDFARTYLEHAITSTTNNLPSTDKYFAFSDIILRKSSKSPSGLIKSIDIIEACNAIRDDNLFALNTFVHANLISPFRTLSLYAMEIYFYWGAVLYANIHASHELSFNTANQIEKNYINIDKKIINHATNIATIEIINKSKRNFDSARSIYNALRRKISIFESYEYFENEMQRFFIYLGESDTTLLNQHTIFWYLVMTLECTDSSIVDTKKTLIFGKKINLLIDSNLDQYFIQRICYIIKLTRNFNVLKKHTSNVAKYRSIKYSKDIADALSDNIKNDDDRFDIIDHLNKNLGNFNFVEINSEWRRALVIEHFLYNILYHLLYDTPSKTIVKLISMEAYCKKNKTSTTVAIERECNIILGAQFKSFLPPLKTKIIKIVDILIDMREQESYENAFFIIKHSISGMTRSEVHTKHSFNLITKLSLLKKQCPTLYNNFKTFFDKNLRLVNE